MTSKQEFQEMRKKAKIEFIIMFIGVLLFPLNFVIPLYFWINLDANTLVWVYIGVFMGEYWFVKFSNLHEEHLRYIDRQEDISRMMEREFLRIEKNMKSER